jgi:hypothetical protein
MRQVLLGKCLRIAGVPIWNFVTNYIDTNCSLETFKYNWKKYIINSAGAMKYNWNEHTIECIPQPERILI